MVFFLFGFDGASPLEVKIFWIGAGMGMSDRELMLPSWAGVLSSHSFFLLSDSSWFLLTLAATANSMVSDLGKVANISLMFTLLKWKWSVNIVGQEDEKYPCITTIMIKNVPSPHAFCGADSLGAGAG